jgi:hypothetical protein
MAASFDFLALIDLELSDKMNTHGVEVNLHIDKNH